MAGILNQLLGGLAGGYQGYAQQEEMKRKRDAELEALQRQARLDSEHEQDRARVTKSDQVLGQHLRNALMGDPDAQAAVIAVRPDLADRFVKPPAAPRTQFVDRPGQAPGMVDLDKNTFTPTAGIAPLVEPKKEPIMGSPEWREAKKFEASLRPEPKTTADDVAEQRKFLRTQALQADYKGNDTVKKAYGVAGAVTGLKAALAGDSPMDDLSTIYETVKLFDPGSVVKEGEIKLTRSANSLPGQVQLLVEGWRSGKKLTPDMRTQIQQLLERKVTELRGAVAPVQSEAGSMARRYGVESDSAYIAPDPFRGVAPSAPLSNVLQGSDTGGAAPGKATAAQRARAATDPVYAQYLRSKGMMP